MREGSRHEPSAVQVGLQRNLQRKLGRWMTEAIAAGLTREDIAALFDSAVHELASRAPRLVGPDPGGGQPYGVEAVLERAHHPPAQRRRATTVLRAD